MTGRRGREFLRDLVSSPRYAQRKLIPFDRENRIPAGSDVKGRVLSIATRLAGRATRI